MKAITCGEIQNELLFVNANSSSHGGNSIHSNMQKLWTQIARALTENQKGEVIEVALNVVVDARWTKLSISKLLIFWFSYKQPSLEFTENGERKKKTSSERQLCGGTCCVDVRGSEVRLVGDQRKATVTHIASGLLGIWCWQVVARKVNTQCTIVFFKGANDTFFTTGYHLSWVVCWMHTKTNQCRHIISGTEHPLSTEFHLYCFKLQFGLWRLFFPKRWAA